MLSWLERQSDARLSLLLFAAAGFWGLYWVPLREIEARGVSDAWSVTWFTACPLLVFLPYILLNWRRFRPHIRPLLFISVATGLGLSFYSVGLVSSTVVRATVLFYLTPVWSTLIGSLWLSERLGFGRILAIVLGFGGLVLLLSNNDGASAPLNVGDVLALLSGLFWGLGAACIKKWPDTPVSGTTSFMFLFTTLASIGLGLLLFTDPFPPMSALADALPIAASASLLVLVPTAFVILWIARRLFPGRVGLLMMSEVLVAILSASLLLPEETMTPLQWVGVAGILGACLAEVVFTPGHASPQRTG